MFSMLTTLKSSGRLQSHFLATGLNSNKLMLIGKTISKEPVLANFMNKSPLS